MNNRSSISKSQWFNYLETFLLGTTIAISGIVALLDFLGVLDSIPWIAERVPIFILLLVGSIAAYLILER